MYVMHGMHNMHACLRGPGFDVCRPSADTGNLHTNLYLSVSAPTCARVNLLWCARAKDARANARARLHARARVCACAGARICPYLSARVRACAGVRAQNDAGVPANTCRAKNNAIYWTGRVQRQKKQKNKKWRAAPGAKIAWRVPKRNFQKLAVPGRHEPGEDNCTG